MMTTYKEFHMRKLICKFISKFHPIWKSFDVHP